MKLSLTYWRLWLGGMLMKIGIRVMPHGRVRSELSALLWTWNMKVTATIAADRIHKDAA